MTGIVTEKILVELRIKRNYRNTDRKLTKVGHITITRLIVSIKLGNYYTIYTSHRCYETGHYTFKIKRC